MLTCVHSELNEKKALRHTGILQRRLMGSLRLGCAPPCGRPRALPFIQKPSLAWFKHQAMAAKPVGVL
jgi:hypothetical protein